MADTYQGPVKVLGGDGILLTTGIGDPGARLRAGDLGGRAGDACEAPP